MIFSTLRVVVPIVLALVAGGLILLALGKDPLAYYDFVVQRGLLSWSGLQQTIIRSAPLLLIAAGLIVAFRAGIWNLGVDGQFLLAAVASAALAPLLIGALPSWLTIVICCAVSVLVAMSWSLVPAFLKTQYGLNEIITTLMMTVADRLGRLFDTTIHGGIIIALVAVFITHFVMTRTAFGLKLQIVGANPRAAKHAGLNVGRLTYAVFALSAGLTGLGGAVEILGVWGTMRADWNPAYGLLVVPLVFLARFHGIAVIALTLFFAILMIGGESASRRLGVPNFYVLVLVALLLIFLALVEYLDHLSRQRKKV